MSQPPIVLLSQSVLTLSFLFDLSGEVRCTVELGGFDHSCYDVVRQCGNIG